MLDLARGLRLAWLPTQDREARQRGLDVTGGTIEFFTVPSNGRPVAKLGSGSECARRCGTSSVAFQLFSVLSQWRAKRSAPTGTSASSPMN